MSVSVADIVFIAIVGLILLFAVVSNFLVIFVVWRNKKMRNVTNILICNLSCSDIILAGIILPQNLHDLSHEDNFHEGTLLCKTIAFAFPFICITSSSYTLACIAYDRKHSVVNCLQKQISVRHLKIIIPCIWLIAILAATPTTIEYNVVEVTVPYGNTTKSTLACNSKSVPHAFSIGNGVTLLIVSYLIPLFIILYNYVKIFIFVMNQTTRALNQTADLSIAQTTLLKKRMKIIKMMVIVAAFFAISRLPFFITLLIGKVTQTDGSEDASDVVSMTMTFLEAFSTAYNVILYLIFNPMFKQSFKNVFNCLKSKIEDGNASLVDRGITIDIRNQGYTTAAFGE